MNWKEFFYFNKSDRTVALAIVVFVVVLWLLKIAVDGKADVGIMDEAVSQDSVLRNETFRSKYENHKGTGYYSDAGGRTVERFAFDPNTADSSQLLRLGLLPWQVRSIYKYRAAGGVYAKPSDFAKLYGLTVKQYKELEPYIRIEGDYRPASVLAKEDSHPLRDTARYPMKLNAEQRVAINSADTNLLKKVPGIGSYYARKIVEYRNRLGGFVDLAQLDEIEGFPADAARYMCIPDGNVRKIKINKLTLNQLKAHPYINFYQARDIVEYRRQRGPIGDLKDLSVLPDFPPHVIERLLPYVEY